MLASPCLPAPILNTTTVVGLARSTRHTATDHGSGEQVIAAWPVHCARQRCHVRIFTISQDNPSKSSISRLEGCGVIIQDEFDRFSPAQKTFHGRIYAQHTGPKDHGTVGLRIQAHTAHR